MKPQNTSLLTLLFIFYSATAFTQITFQKSFEKAADWVYGGNAEQTFNGGYILVGHTNNLGAGSTDINLINTDQLGDTLWTRIFGGSGYEYGYDVHQTTDSGFIIVGSTTSFGSGSSDVYLLKTDNSGNLQWSKTYGGNSNEIGYSLSLTNDGGYIIIGSTYSFGFGNADIYVIKTDAAGDTLWTKAYGGGNFDKGITVRQTSDGGYMLCGQTTSFGFGSSNHYIIKTDSLGNVLWSKVYNASGWPGTIIETMDGGYFIAGASDQSPTAGSYDIYLLKIDSTGAIIWSKVYGTSGPDYGMDAYQKSNGHYVISGYIYMTSNGNGCMIEVDSTGNLIWCKMYGVGGDIFLTMDASDDGGYISFGYGHLGSNNPYMPWLIKTDSTGNTGCLENSITPVAGSFTTQMQSPATLVTIPSSIVTSANTIQSEGGTVNTFCSSGVNEVRFGEVKIYPNPLINSSVIELPSPGDEAELVLYNMLGKAIMRKMFRHKIEIEKGNLISGIYLLQVNDGENNYALKLIIQ